LKIGVIAAVAAVGGALIVLHRLAPGLLPVDRSVHETQIRCSLEEIPEGYLVDGMAGVENLYVDPVSNALYATDLHGSLHVVDGASWDALSIVRSVRLGESALGVDRGPDGALYVCVSEVGLGMWRTIGGSLVRLAPDLESWERLTEPHPAINGLAFDRDGRAFFASSRFSPLNPVGGVYRIRVTEENSSPPELRVRGQGMTNGLRYSPVDGRIYFTETLVGVFAFAPEGREPTVVYRKARRFEAFDDLCVDGDGRLWMADPGRSTVKLYDPETHRLVRFRIRGIGQTSACAIRRSEGREILYVTELHRSTHPLFGARDGRGVLVVPVDQLLERIRAGQAAE
jgi:sugar lactone lactonase YvrE